MNVVDTKGEMGDFLSDPNRKIPNAHLNSVCKLYEKHETCRYICLYPIGFVCAKKTPMKKMLDQRVAEGKMTARSDNCEGLGEIWKKL